MTIRENIEEIKRVKVALNKTNSHQLITDYSKYLKRLHKDLSYTCRVNNWSYKKVLIQGGLQ